MSESKERVKYKPSEIQALLAMVQKAKDRRQEEQDLKNRKGKRYEIKTTYKMNGNQHDLTMDMGSTSDLNLWKEAEGFLRDLFQDETIDFVKAEILEMGNTKFYTDDYFFTWRRT